MQDFFYSHSSHGAPLTTACYAEDMRGRPSKIPRSTFGERLFHAREQAGLSQQQLAQKIGVSQQDIARWERETTWFNIEHLSKLAKILNSSIDELLGLPVKKVILKPTGKARQLFERVSNLPRRQQEKILEVVEGFVALRTNHKQAA
jgi:transcriptional regulator with XRE-family HTH domain